ncbi:MAG: universal stress protein [Planctomycetota bacterium]|jgi:nucleotide-binding universal stress UspA family protein
MERPIKTILVPVDFSPVTEPVMDVARTIATACGARIFLVHVAPAFVADLKGVKIPQHERDFVAHKLRDEHRDLQHLADDLATDGCPVEPLMVEGDGTVGKIVDEAQRLEADLIVVGSHGHGKLYEMLIGSTCEGILRKVGIPVLIVPAAAA